MGTRVIPNYARPGAPVHQEIVGGFIVTAEGRGWFKRNYTDEPLDPDGSEDLTVPLRLAGVIQERGYPFDLESVLPQCSQQREMFLVTRFFKGVFINTGPPGVEEILQGDPKPLLIAGDREDVVRERVLKELGWLVHNVDCVSWN